MTESLRKEAGVYASALASYGQWCIGVTSNDPKVRSAMYAQLRHRLRAKSPHIQNAARTVLENNVHGIWMQLVDDFSIQREEYTPQDLDLKKIAAQLLWAILADKVFLEKLDPLDVQTFILEVVTRASYLLQNKPLLDDQLESLIMLIGAPANGWWEGQTTCFTQAVCKRLCEILDQVDILSGSSLVQMSLLQIFMIVYTRPYAKGLSVAKFFSFAWDLMWNEDEDVKQCSRLLITKIADNHGGQPGIVQVVKEKYRSPALLHHRLFTKIKDEIAVFPEEGLILWLLITRLVKEHITDLARDRLYFWLEIPRKLLFSPMYGRMAAANICYLIYYCQDLIDKCQKTFYIFAFSFTREGTNVLLSLKTLDACLNGFYVNNPFRERIPADRERPPPNLRFWARMTVGVLNYPRDLINTDDLRQQVDPLLAHIFCHWHCLINMVTDVTAFKGGDEVKRTQDFIDIYTILGKEFAGRIRDANDELLLESKHAVHTFWVNLLVVILSRDLFVVNEVFPVEFLRGLLKMIIAALYSTQIRIRQATYRFIVNGNVLGGIRWLVEKDAVELLTAVEYCRENFETETWSELGVMHEQVYDYGTVVKNYTVESREFHPCTLSPVAPEDQGGIEWVWYTPQENEEMPLGDETAFEENLLGEFLQARDKRETRRKRRKEEAMKERSERKRENAARAARLLENRSRSPLQMLQIQGSQSNTSTSTTTASSKDPQPPSASQDTNDQRSSTSASPGNSASQASNQPSQERLGNPDVSAPKQDQSRSEGSSARNVPSQRLSPISPVKYDRRMPPPPVDWRLKAGSGSQRVATSRVSEKSAASQNVKEHQKLQTAPTNNVDDIVNKKVQEAQDVNAPPAKGSFITGKRNQLDARIPTGTGVGSGDLEEKRAMNKYIRDGDDRIGILSGGWKEVEELSETNESSSSSRKRSRDEDGAPTSISFKKRKLKSDYCPAKHTTWKPAWLDTIQCYPVDQNGEDMSDVECLRGDGIHRNADKLQQILETECMYVPSHRVDQMMSVVQETYDALKRTKEFYTNEHPRQVRIERNEFMDTD